MIPSPTSPAKSISGAIMEGSHAALFANNTQQRDELDEASGVSAEPPRRHPQHRYSREEILGLAPNRLSDFGDRSIDFFDTDSSEVEEAEAAAMPDQFSTANPMLERNLQSTVQQGHVADLALDHVVEHPNITSIANALKPHELKHVTQRIPEREITNNAVSNSRNVPMMNKGEVVEQNRKHDSYTSINKIIAVSQDALRFVIPDQNSHEHVPTLAERREERILSLHNVTLQALLQSEIAESRRFLVQHEDASTPASYKLGSRPSPLRPDSRAMASLPLRAQLVSVPDSLVGEPSSAQTYITARAENPRKKVTLPPPLAKPNRWPASPQIVRTPWPFTSSPTSPHRREWEDYEPGYEMNGGAGPDTLLRNPIVVVHLRLLDRRRDYRLDDTQIEQIEQNEQHLCKYRQGGGSTGYSMRIHTDAGRTRPLLADNQADEMDDAKLLDDIHCEYRALRHTPSPTWRLWTALSARGLRQVTFEKRDAQRPRWREFEEALGIDTSSRTVTKHFFDNRLGKNKHDYVAVALGMARESPPLTVCFEHGWAGRRIALVTAGVGFAGAAVVMAWVFGGPGWHAGQEAYVARAGMALVLGLLVWLCGAVGMGAWLALSWAWC